MDPNTLLVSTSALLVITSLAFLTIKFLKRRYLTPDDAYLAEYFRDFEIQEELNKSTS